MNNKVNNNYLYTALAIFLVYFIFFTFAEAQVLTEKQNAPYINLLENAGFESNLAKWSKVGSLGTFITTSSTTTLLQGKYSAHLTFGSSTQSAAACSNYYDPQSLKNSNGEMGFSYRFSSINPASGTVFVEDASGTVLSKMDLDITLLGEKRDASKLFAFNDKPARLCMLGKGTSAVPWGIVLDNTWLGSPRNVTQGPIVSGKQEQYTPTTINGFGTTTNKQFYWSRVGSKIFIEGSFTVGTPTATGAYITLPDGLKVAAKYLSGFAYVVGQGGTSANGANITVIVRRDICDSCVYFSYSASGINNLTPQNGNQIANSAGAFSFKAELEIDGWATTGTAFTGMCKDAYECESTFSSSISNSPAVTTSNIAGWIASVTGTNSKTITFKSGLFSAAPICQVTPNGTANIEHAISSVTNSTVVVNSYSSAGSPANEGFNISCSRSTDHIQKKVIQGYLSEQNLLVSYYASANKSSSPTQPIDFDTKEYDATNCNCVTTGSNWKFTAPRTGYYDVNVFAYPTGGTGTYTRLHVGGTLLKTIDYLNSSLSIFTSASVPVYLKTGEYIDVRLRDSNTVFGGALNVQDGAAKISIKWIGN